MRLNRSSVRQYVKRPARVLTTPRAGLPSTAVEARSIGLPDSTPKADPPTPPAPTRRQEYAMSRSTVSVVGPGPVPERSEEGHEQATAFEERLSEVMNELALFQWALEEYSKRDDGSLQIAAFCGASTRLEWLKRDEG